MCSCHGQKECSENLASSHPDVGVHLRLAPAPPCQPAHSTHGVTGGRCHSYAGTGVIFDLFTLGALIAASLQFQTDSGAFMSAVKEIAGTSGGNTGLNVVDKAAQARSTLKVLGALSSISKLLQVRAAPGSK
jgi:hypothetical protein